MTLSLESIPFRWYCARGPAVALLAPSGNRRRARNNGKEPELAWDELVWAVQLMGRFPTRVGTRTIDDLRVVKDGLKIRFAPYRDVSGEWTRHPNFVWPTLALPRCDEPRRHRYDVTALPEPAARLSQRAVRPRRPSCRSFPREIDRRAIMITARPPKRCSERPSVSVAFDFVGRGRHRTPATARRRTPGRALGRPPCRARLKCHARPHPARRPSGRPASSGSREREPLDRFDGRKGQRDLRVNPAIIVVTRSGRGRARNRALRPAARH